MSNSLIKSKILTIIANSKITDLQKVVLETYINQLHGANLALLFTVFKKYPKSVSAYADFIKNLQTEVAPISDGRFEEIFSTVIGELI